MGRDRHEWSRTIHSRTHSLTHLLGNVAPIFGGLLLLLLLLKCCARTGLLLVYVGS